MYTPSFRTIDSTAQPRAEVIWIHHAGGTTNTLAHRMRMAGSQCDIRLRTPRMPAREELVDVSFDGDLDQLAALLAGAIVEQRAEQQEPLPLVLVGHSFGSVIAYRMAIHLARREIVPRRLVVMSFPPPIDLSHEQSLAELSDDELLSQVDQLFGAVPEEIRNDREAQQYFVPSLRFDIGLLARYEHDPEHQQIGVPILAIGGTEDRAVDVADMHGWKPLSSSQFRLQSMPGDHFFPLQRFVEVLQAATWDIQPG